VGVILAVACPTAETTIHDDMVGRLFDVRGDHLGGHRDTLGAQGFIDREVGDGALAPVQPGMNVPQQGNIPEEKWPLDGTMTGDKQGFVLHHPSDE